MASYDINNFIIPEGYLKRNDIYEGFNIAIINVDINVKNNAWFKVSFIMWIYLDSLYLIIGIVLKVIGSLN